MGQKQLSWWRQITHQTMTQEWVDQIVAEMAEVYEQDERPWVIGFSGGKDSSAVVQLAYRMLMHIDGRQKPVYIVSSDTLVENPVVADWVDRCHAELREVAGKYGLPIHVAKVQPDPRQTFWVLLLGKGYPAPTNDFRWCTSRLKIDPVEAWILSNVHPEGRVMQLLGTRKVESRSRAASIEAHALEGKFGTSGGKLTEAIIYQPIMDLDNDNVWEYLLGFEKPWGGTNSELWDIYQGAHGGECVLDFDRRTASCGASRFGCWTCTVVDQDKSMTNMVNYNTPEFAPLLAFREKIKALREDWTKREVYGRNGRLRFARTMRDEDGNQLLGPFITPGPYRFEIRYELVRDLLQIEQQLAPWRTLTDSDLYWIQHQWTEDGGDPDMMQRLLVEAGRLPPCSDCDGRGRFDDIPCGCNPKGQG